MLNGCSVIVLIREMASRQLLSTSKAVLSKRLAHSEVQISQTLKDQYYPKLGNRDIVSYGWNSIPTYADRAEFPCPAVRYRENTKEVQALRQKEQGDWKSLSLADKKALYRASFRQTYAEFQAPTGEWKSIVAMILMAFSVTGLVFTWIKHHVLPPLPDTITKEWQEKQLENMIRQRQGPVEGISSHWDYEKNDWK